METCGVLAVRHQGFDLPRGVPASTALDLMRITGALEDDWMPVTDPDVFRGRGIYLAIGRDLDGKECFHWLSYRGQQVFDPADEAVLNIEDALGRYPVSKVLAKLDLSWLGD